MISTSVGLLRKTEVQLNGTKEGAELLTMLLRIFSYESIVERVPSQSLSQGQQEQRNWPYSSTNPLAVNIHKALETMSESCIKFEPTLRFPASLRTRPGGSSGRGAVRGLYHFSQCGFDSNKKSLQS